MPKSQESIDFLVGSTSFSIFQQVYNFDNLANLKESAPISTKRKIVMTVPVSSSGVPFMPKTAQSTESQTLYFESKHKLIMESTIETTGAPYTDTFQVNLKSVVESD